MYWSKMALILICRLDMVVFMSHYYQKTKTKTKNKTKQNKKPQIMLIWDKYIFVLWVSGLSASGKLSSNWNHKGTSRIIKDVINEIGKPLVWENNY